MEEGDSAMSDHKETKKEQQQEAHTTSREHEAERKEAEHEIREAARHATHEREEERKQAEEEIREAARKVTEEPDKVKKQKKHHKKYKRNNGPHEHISSCGFLLPLPLFRDIIRKAQAMKVPL